MKIFLNKISVRQYILYGFMCIAILVSMIFVHHNYSLYDRPIAKVTKAELIDTKENIDMHNNKDTIHTQHLTAILKNGENKGQTIYLNNTYSSSAVYDQQYDVGDELFVWIRPQTDDESNLRGNIVEVKRDKYLLLLAWVFIVILLMVGKKQGLFSIISLGVNALLISFALDIHIFNPNISLLLICGFSVFLFTIFSLILVSGFNEKTLAAIIATLIGTVTSLIIAYVVIETNDGYGLRYEDMQFLTRHYQSVFMAGLFIGSLGGVMDIAITMSSSMFALYEKNNSISIKSLTKSGLDIGKDIMGAITSILFFAYISGSIPTLILYFKNSSALGFTLSMNLSLELARALVGGIGIVLTIPIALYTCIFFIKRKRARV